MMGYEALNLFLREWEQGGGGLYSRYADRVAKSDPEGEVNYWRLAGHYQRLLTDLIQLIGTDSIVRIIKARQQLDDAINKGENSEEEPESC